MLFRAYPDLLRDKKEENVLTKLLFKNVVALIRGSLLSRANTFRGLCYNVWCTTIEDKNNLKK